MSCLFENYQLRIVDKENNSCAIKLNPIQGQAMFNERRKLYVISNNFNEVLYVGEAHTSIKTRLQRGCVAYNYYVKNNFARGGYKGYKWLDKIENVDRDLNLLVVVFDETADTSRSFVEAIEGELVYLIRQKSGKWPRFQNEIHFNNCEKAYEVAETILKRLGAFDVF